MNIIFKKIESFFRFQQKSTTFKKEIIGGISTFMAMAYILAVNPSMLKNAGGGNDYEGVFFLGTAISAFIATMLMGLVANVPVALAPGMGVNAFFTYTVAGPVLGLTLEQALVATFFSGVLYAIVALTPARVYVAKLLPKNFKLAIGAMIGLFLAYLGLTNSGIIVSDAFAFSTESGEVVTGVATNTKLGNFKDPYVIIALITMLLVFSLHFMKINGAALWAMLSAVIMLAIGYAAGIEDSDQIFKLQDYQGFNKFGELSSGMWSSLGNALGNGKIYIAIFVFLYMDFFDTTGTLFAIDEQAKISESDENWIVKANIVDAASSVFGSVMLTSTVTSFVESTVGVSQGARTGFASMVTGSMFALSIAAWPLLSCVMPIAHIQDGVGVPQASIQPVTGPILILVGALMISQLKHFEWIQTIDIPVLFSTLIFGTFSASIANGIAFGVLVYYTINSIALFTKFIKDKQGKPFIINDEDIPMSEINKDGNKDSSTTQPNFKQRVLNPVMISMFILSITYICTMPLYAF